MKKNLLALFLVLPLLAAESFSQDTSKSIVNITLGAGVLTFNGDVGKNTAKGQDVSSYTFIRGGYSLNIEKRFVQNKLGASLNIMTGKLAKGERSKDTTRNNNFESSIMQFGVNLTYYFQNNKGTPLVPYFTAGFAYATLKTNADLKYGGDSLYHYWSDGSIRNLPEKPANLVSAHHVTRDYIYETPIDSAAKSTMCLPIGFGLKMKVGKKIEANIGLTYHLSFTDGIDAMKGKGKDQYLFSYFSVTYNLMKKPKEVVDKSNIDFATIDKTDNDKDGVKDDDDLCPGTPKGVKVDGKGCPLDEDNDGVPDYLDKEAGTKKGSLVDSQGKTITDAMILEKAIRDSLSQGRTNTFMNAPSSESLKKIDTDIKKNQAGTASAIPKQFLSADANHDGVISSTEITAIVDGFFDGSNDYTVEKINALIDFFFEQ
jgi:hypothetical protein